jgi:hypothetical protein
LDKGIKHPPNEMEYSLRFQTKTEYLIIIIIHVFFYKKILLLNVCFSWVQQEALRLFEDVRYWYLGGN